MLSSSSHGEAEMTAPLNDQQLVESVVDACLAMLRNEQTRFASSFEKMEAYDYSDVCAALAVVAMCILDELGVDASTDAVTTRRIAAQMNEYFTDGFFAPEQPDVERYLDGVLGKVDITVESLGFDPLGQLMFQLAVTAGLSALLGIKNNSPVAAELRGWMRSVVAAA